MSRIILDTDPGIDDALALLLALSSPEVQLEAITTVSGNVHVDLTTRNALALLELAGRSDIPVARGCEQPLAGTPVYAAHVHGQNGFGEVELPEPVATAVALPAYKLLIEKILGAPGEITLVAIGPLTNLALALRADPRIVQAVHEVVIMGGAVRVPGNVTPHAEFNIYADPQAAHVVFHAGWPMRLVSLDVTSQTLLQRAQIDELTAAESPVSDFIAQILHFYLDTFAGPRGVTSFTMHDPLCLAAAFLPELITWERAAVDVELTDPETLGQTLLITSPAAVPNMLVPLAVDAERFLQLFLERVKTHFASAS